MHTIVIHHALPGCDVLLQFHEMREESRGQSPLLTPEQQNWLTIQNIISRTGIQVRHDPFRVPVIGQLLCTH